MSNAFYRYTNRRYATWLDKQRGEFEKIHGIKLSCIDAESILVNKILIPSNVRLSDSIKAININKKWKKLKLRI